MRWSETESKTNLGFGLGKAFTLLIRSKTDRRHRVVCESKVWPDSMIVVVLLIWWEFMWKADGEEGRWGIVKRAYWFVVGRL